MKPPAEVVFASIKGIFLAGNGVAITEGQIRKEYDEFEGKGALDTVLSSSGLSLGQLLRQIDDIESCGGGRWRNVVTADTAHLAQSIGNKKGGKGGRGGRTNGGSGSRGGGGGRGGFGGRGGVANRGRGNASYGYSFRPQAPPPRNPNPPPQNNFQNQRPLAPRNNNFPPIDRFDDRSFNSNPANNFYNDPPRNRSPPRRFDSPARSNTYQEPYYNEPRRNDNRYMDDEYNRRRDFSPGRSDRRRRSPSYSPGPPPNRMSYRDRSPSPPPSRNFDGPSSSQNGFQSRPPGIRSPYRHHSPPGLNYPPPPGLGSPPGLTRRRNEFPPRPDSPQSNYSQRSIEEEPLVSTSRALQRERALISNNPIGMEDIAERFGGTQGIEGSEGKNDKKIAKTIRKFMKDVHRKQMEEVQLARSERRTMPEEDAYMIDDLISEIENKGIKVPGSNMEKQEIYIREVAKRFPEYLKPLVFDEYELQCNIKWRPENAITSPAPTPNPMEMFATHSANDELQQILDRHLQSMSSSKFSCKELVERVMNETGKDRGLVTGKLTFLLFKEYKDQYRYAAGSDDLIIKQGRDSSSVEVDDRSHRYKVPLVHKLFARPSNRTISVEISRFANINKFGVRPVKFMDEYEEMDETIQEDMENEDMPDAPKDGWRKDDACMVKHKIQDIVKWLRAVILRIEGTLFRVYFLDVGMYFLMTADSLRTMPQKYLLIQPYAIPCFAIERHEENYQTAKATDWKSIINRSSKTWIELPEKFEPKMDEGISTYRVTLYMETLGKKRENVLERVLEL